MRLICLSQRFTRKSPRLCRRLFVSRDDLPRELLSLQKGGIQECLILSTCLRFEIYAAAEEGADERGILDAYLRNSHGFSIDNLDGSITLFEGDDAVRHLFSVACGLDSEILGEKQIVRQIKNAYRAARETETTGKVLNRLFQKSLAVSKKVRSRTGIDIGASSAAALAARKLSALHEDLSRKRVLILGAGQMGKLAGVHLGAKGCGRIRFTSRSLEHARATAEQCGVDFVPYDRFCEELEKADILVTATGAPHVILHLEEMEEAMKRRGGRSLCIADLAEPPDMDGRAASLAGVTYFTIEDVNRMAEETRVRRAAAACEALSMVEESTAAFSWRPAGRRSPEKRREPANTS